MNWFHRLNRRYLLRYRLEYGVALCLVYGVRALSPSFVWRTARTLGRLLFRLGVRRRTMLANLAIAFPEMDEAERRRLAERSMEHFASMCVDMIFQRRMLSRRNVLEKIEFVGWARDYMDEHGVEGLRRRAQRVLFITAHLGNWEIATGMFGLLGVRIDPVFRSPQNPFIARLLRRIRLESQDHVIEKRGAVRAMMERFDRDGNVGFLFDQEAVHGLDIPFFGRPACTHKTPALLARDHGIKIFFGVIVRRGDFLRYEARGELIDLSIRSGDKQADLAAILTDLMGRLENEIRQDPEQYLWAHRRWKRAGVHGLEHVREKRT